MRHLQEDLLQSGLAQPQFMDIDTGLDQGAVQPGYRVRADLAGVGELQGFVAHGDVKAGAFEEFRSLLGRACLDQDRGWLQSRLRVQ